MPEPSDTRRHQAETERHLMIGGFVILVVVGGGLILLFYGRGATLTGLLCFGGAALIFGLLFLVLKLFEHSAGD
jgi:hypothetical protein